MKSMNKIKQNINYFNSMLIHSFTWLFIFSWLFLFLFSFLFSCSFFWLKFSFFFHVLFKHKTFICRWIGLNWIEWVKHNFVHIKLFVALLLVRGSLWSMWSHGYVIMKITFIKLHYITLHHITLHCTLCIALDVTAFLSVVWGPLVSVRKCEEQI